MFSSCRQNLGADRNAGVLVMVNLITVLGAEGLRVANIGRSDEM